MNRAGRMRGAVLYRFAPADPGGTVVKQSSKNGPAIKVKICEVERVSIGLGAT
jgi:hypothetical protein